MDGNLAEVGAQFSTFDQIWVPVDSSGKGILELSFNYNRSFTIFARDAYGAYSTGVNRSVTLYQDDCGTGDDIDVYGITFGEKCRAHLARAMGDDRDSFTFEVPTGSSDRLALEYARHSGGLRATVTATAPSGTIHAVDSDSLFLPSVEVGSWRVDVNRRNSGCCPERDPHFGGFDFRPRFIGAPAPPSANAEFVPNSIHRFESTTLSFAGTDPNNEYLSFVIDGVMDKPKPTDPETSSRVRNGITFPILTTYL